jgi:hypothetical protein
MTAWGVAPARGRLRICGTCGATVAFVESGRRTPEGAMQVIRAIESHLLSSTRCRDASTFAGPEVVACRCLRPLPLPREEGLLCGRCEGLIAPEVAAAPPVERRIRRPSRGAR